MRCVFRNEMEWNEIPYPCWSIPTVDGVQIQVIFISRPGVGFIEDLLIRQYYTLLVLMFFDIHSILIELVEI